MLYSPLEANKNISAYLSREYTADYTFQGAAGNPGTIAISVHRQVHIYGRVKWGTINVTHIAHAEREMAYAGLESMMLSDALTVRP